jgi:dipeptidyl aminopeptidase/acylaminoacyl peptidase
MKINIIIMIGLLTSNFLGAQNRIASHVTFNSGDETIEGILVRPDVEGKLPAVVFQQGSGDHSFDGYENEAWGPHKYYIEDILLEQGYAVLYCNKRGLGNSTGKWQHNDFYGRADDAYAAVTFLKSLPDIDSTRIGISGHSQGGWIAQIVAAQHEDVAFVIALAGPTVSVKAQTGSNDSLRYMCEGYLGEKLTKRMKKDRKNKQLGYNVGKRIGIIGSARFWYLIADYDNDEVLKSIHCPTLLLFAEYDINVPPDQNIGHFNQLFEDNPPANFTIKVMQGGQHGFYKVADRCVDWDTASQQPFDSEFRESIKRWVKKLD